MLRVTFHMGQGPAGWSYSWFMDGTSAPAVVKELATPNNEVIQALGQLHASGVQILAVGATRVPQTPAEFASMPKSSDLRYIYFDARPSEPGDGRLGEEVTTLAPDLKRASIIVRLRTATNGYDLHLVGVPDSWTRRDIFGGRQPPSELVDTKIPALITALRDNNFKMSMLKPLAADGADALHQVDNITAEAGSGDVNSVVEFRSDAHGWLTGQRILFPGVDDCVLAGFAGSHKILDVPNPDQVVIAVRYRSKEEQISPVRLYARRVSLDTESFLNDPDSGFKGYGSRKVGRRVDQPIGRRQAKSCRR